MFVVVWWVTFIIVANIRQLYRSQGTRRHKENKEKFSLHELEGYSDSTSQGICYHYNLS